MGTIWGELKIRCKGLDTLTGEKRLARPTGCFSRGRVLRSHFEGSRFQILGNLYCQNEMSGNAMYLFSIDGWFPKLNVAGSIPVSEVTALAV